MLQRKNIVQIMMMVLCFTMTTKSLWGMQQTLKEIEQIQKSTNWYYRGGMVLLANLYALVATKGVHWYLQKQTMCWEENRPADLGLQALRVGAGLGCLVWCKLYWNDRNLTKKKQELAEQKHE